MFRDLIQETKRVIESCHNLQDLLEEERVMSNVIGISNLDAKIEILEELLVDFKEESLYTNMHHAIVITEKNLAILNKVRGGIDE